MNNLEELNITPEMKLSPNFTLFDLIKSDVAISNGWDNTPSPSHVLNLIKVCENVLEPVLEHYKKPIQINSGYRGYVLNRALGGSRGSQHAFGMAVDFEIEEVPTIDLALWVAKNCEFDQIILVPKEVVLSGQSLSSDFYQPQNKSINKGWVHVSYSEGFNRKQRLTAVPLKTQTLYKPGFLV